MNVNALKLAAAAAALSGFAMAPAATIAATPPLAQAQAKASQVHTGQGTVKKVNAAAGKLNLDHGPIASLGWSGMTMDFQVKDPVLLKGLKPGQKIEFDLAADGPGKFVITRITPVK